MLELSDEYIESLLKGVYDGTITKYDLPEDLYYSISDYLKKGLYDGFGTTLTKLTKQLEEGTGFFEEADLELLTELRENIYMFGAAKTFAQVEEMQEGMFNEDGMLRTWEEFRDFARGIYDQYNENWLKAEYDTAIGQAQNAVKWNEIEKSKEALPYLQYIATEDELECEICSQFNNLLAPVDDPIWDTCYPENHFRCRCLVIQVDKYEEVNLTPDEDKQAMLAGAEENMNDVFKMNAGKDRLVFNENHPYFSVSKGDKGFARENFGLTHTRGRLKMSKMVNTCTKKVFASRHAAKIKAKIFNKEGRLDKKITDVYYCNQCSGYHMTSMKKSRSRKLTQILNNKR
jgi:SPP1 gp7 family putative phage head morphogenesis protein